MADLPSTILTPAHALNVPGPLPPLALTTHALPTGTLHAIYTLETHLPHFAITRGGHMDPRVTHFDYSPRYAYTVPSQDGKGADVEHSVICAARFGLYILQEIYLAPAAGGDAIPLFKWQQVVDEFVFPPAENLAGVGIMRRADPKIAERIYDLEDGSEVFDSRAQRVTLLHGTKYVLEFDEERVELLELAHRDDLEGE